MIARLHGSVSRVANWHFKMPNNSNLAFSKSFGSEKLALAVWHIFGIIFTTLAVKFLDWQ